MSAAQAPAEGRSAIMQRLWRENAELRAALIEQESKIKIITSPAFIEQHLSSYLAANNLMIVPAAKENQ